MWVCSTHLNSNVSQARQAGVLRSAVLEVSASRLTPFLCLASAHCFICRMGLVLEWVYGTIVSTAEKARDGAKRQLGVRPPTAQAAFDALMRCLEDQHNWEQRAKASKELLNQMLQSRKEADELSKQYNIQPNPDKASSSSSSPSPTPATGDTADGATGDSSSSSSSLLSRDLPDVVILKMLKREALLTSAKLHALTSDLLDHQRTIMRLKSSIRHVCGLLVPFDCAAALTYLGAWQTCSGRVWHLQLVGCGSAGRARYTVPACACSHSDRVAGRDVGIRAVAVLLVCCRVSLSLSV